MSGGKRPSPAASTAGGAAIDTGQSRIRACDHAIPSRLSQLIFRHRRLLHFLTCPASRRP